MNERLEQLAEQAKELAEQAFREDNAKRFTMTEKFAELIVHRTLDIVDAHTEIFQTDRDKALIEHIKQSINKDFGIK